MRLFCMLREDKILQSARRHFEEIQPAVVIPLLEVLPFIQTLQEPVIQPQVITRYMEMQVVIIILLLATYRLRIILPAIQMWPRVLLHLELTRQEMRMWPLAHMPLMPTLQVSATWQWGHMLCKIAFSATTWLQ